MAGSFKSLIDPLKDNMDDVLSRINWDLDHAYEYRRWYAERWLRYYRKYRNFHDPEFLKYRGDKFTIFVPLLFSLIENLVPRFVQGTFGTYPYINVVPVGPEDIEGGKKAEKLLNLQLNNDNLVLKAIAWVKQFCMYGTSPAKIVWKEQYVNYMVGTKEKRVAKYVGPSFMALDVLDLLIDPKATDEGVSSSGYIIQTIILGEEEMRDRMANAKSYQYNFSGINWESERIFPSSEMVDKFNRETDLKLSNREASHRGYWRFDEYWTPTALITVFNRKYIIRRVPNRVMGYPFVNLNRNPLLGDFYGIGDIEAVETLIDQLNYVRNLRIDNLDLIINLMFLLERTAEVDTRELVAKPGGFILTNDIQGIKQLEFKDMSMPALREESQLKQEIQEVSGIMDMFKGLPPQGMNETASGMAMLLEGASYRIKLGLQLIENYGIKQIGDLFMRFNYLQLPKDYIAKVAGDSEWLSVKEPEEIFGNYDYVPSGSSEFLNKEMLRQSVLQLYNLLARDPNVDQVGLKRLLATAFGGRMVETILLGNVQQQQQQPSPQEGGQEMGQELGPQDEGEMIQKENESMLNGQEVPPIGDHAQHIQGHQAIMSAPEFSQLSSGIQGIFGRHVEGHVRATQSGQGVALENPERFSSTLGAGQEETMKSALQRPIVG